MDRNQMNALFEAMVSIPAPDTILMGGWQYAVFDACRKFQGRDRRRIKREMNKAGKKYRRRELSNA